MDGSTRVASTSDLSAAELGAVHDLMLVAFSGDFSQEDWEHTIGGHHFLNEIDGSVVTHASVIERTIEVDGQPFRTGYVEGVGTHPDLRRRGHGSAVVAAATSHIRNNYEFGALGTSSFAFYERLGWERWKGPTYVRANDRLLHTAEEDGFVMVLRFGASAAVDLASPIACDPRSGDVW